MLDENYHLKFIDFGTAKVLNRDLQCMIPRKPKKAEVDSDMF